jgi:hypothetical protein
MTKPPTLTAPTPKRAGAGCRAALLVLAFAALSQPACAALWKWTDANGRVVYSDIPPAGDVKAERVNGPSPPANPNAAKELASQEAELKKRQMDRADEAGKADKAKADAAQRQQSCARARAQISALQIDNVQHYRINERGERIVMDAAMRRQERQRMEAYVRDTCPAQR